MALHKYYLLCSPVNIETGPTFAKKTGALRKSLNKLGIDLVFPTAPHKIQPADASSLGEREKLLEAQATDGEWQYWGWAFADDETKDMRGLKKSVEFIGNILETQVLFDVVFGG